MSEAELLDAAEILGQFQGRHEARLARGEVMRRLNELGYEDTVGRPEAVEEVSSLAWPAVDGPTPLQSGFELAGPAAGTGSHRRIGPLGVIRLVGAGVLAAAAIAVWNGMAPSQIPDSRRAVDAALSDYQQNEAKASGAPQQAVVGGWVARDLLTVMAVNAGDSARADQQASDRLAAEAALLVVGVAFGLAVRSAD
jgi:hypothetical protein